MSVGSLARPPPRRRSLARGSTSLALISKVSRASTKRRAAAPPCRCPVPARSGAAPWHHALCRFGAASGELRLLSLDGARDGCAALQVSGVLIIAKGHASASELKRVIQRTTSEPAIATPRLLTSQAEAFGRLPAWPLLASFGCEQVWSSQVRKTYRLCVRAAITLTHALLVPRCAHRALQPLAARGEHDRQWAGRADGRGAAS